MKKTLSMLLAVMFVLTAFGVSTIFGGVLGAGAVFYDYFEYTQFPGFSAFSAGAIADHAWQNACTFTGFSSDYKPDGVDQVATFTCTTPDQYHGMVLAPLEVKNDQTSTYGVQKEPMWCALDTIEGKDMFGNSKDGEGQIVLDTTFEDCAGFCFWVGNNGGHFDGDVKIQLFAIPTKGVSYSTDNDGGTTMSDYGSGCIFECSGKRADEDGYVYFDFKTDFYWPGWWYADDDGNFHNTGNMADHFPISAKYLVQLNAVCIRLGGVQSGDVVSVGDFRMYKDTRIHVDELEEQCAIFDDLDPEAYTEESYSDAMEIYLEAFEMLQNPDQYTQKQVDAMATELKHAIRDLKPMFKAEKKSVKLAGFEVWDDDDFEAMMDGGLCVDTPAIEEDNVPSTREQSVLVYANAVAGEPYYGWSCFTNATEDGGAIKNPFELEEGSEPLSEASGIRFWIKWDDSLDPIPNACRIGLGVSSKEIYFECEETAVELPAKQGYIGVAWTNFYDVNGDEDIYDWIDSLDTIYIYFEDVSGIYYIADLTGFEWSISSADFTTLESVVTAQSAYMNTLDETLYYSPSWERAEAAIEAGRGLLGQYGVTQEEVDEAIEEINYAINHLKLLGDLADGPTLAKLNGLYKSGKTYWRGNLVQRTYMTLSEELDNAERLIAEGPTQVEAEAAIAALQSAIAGLVPIQAGSTVNTIFSFESYTNRDLSRATGDRTANVVYELNSDFAKLPAGYSQALKMTAQADMGSETTMEHGMMQFKSMYRDKSNHPTPIKMEGSGSTAVNTLIGDLSGTAGLCLWVGVNDMDLVQNCTMRFAVSNCEVGPLFERATVDIPVPATGAGWLYLPWEYFEYYDDWTHGQDIDLAKIFFYIVRFDGVVKQGLEVYVTGIHAYSNPQNGTWNAPVISNITEGQSFDVSEQNLIPDWNVGAAMLDGKFLIYGDPVVTNGEHELVVTNGDKSTTVHFTTSGAIEYEMPTASVENGKSYVKPVAITWTPEDATAELDGIPLMQGDLIEEAGNYTLVVTNGDKVLTVKFTVTDEPAVKKGDMDKDGEITVNDALKALRIAAKLAAASDEDMLIGDVDGDGDITVNDALKILRVAAKLAGEDSLG